MCMEYFCAIDGGGTSSKCIVSSKDGKVFENIGKSSNIYAVGMYKAIENIQNAIKEAFLNNNIDIKDLKSIHIASAGLGDEKNQEIIKKELSITFSYARITTSDDALPLLVSKDSISGICLIVGTGSIAFGIDNHKNRIRSGGFGWRLGDEGSAYWIAKEGIRRTLYSKESIDLETDLQEDILSYFHIENLKDIIYFINDEKRTKAEIANFSTYVLQRAENKDVLALDIIEEAISHLSSNVTSIIKRLKNPHEKKITIAGGVVTHYKSFAEKLREEIEKEHPEYKICIAAPDRAKQGALILAMAGF